MTFTLTPFIHKRVTFRFARQELTLALSQSLFSSFDVDIGSRFLLKTVAKFVDLTAVATILDVGSGVGVIGLSVQKTNPALELTAQDRDALAMAFTAHNAELNGLTVELPGGLGLQALDGRTFDLILSNLPGKVGRPVLADMLARMAGHLTPDGRAAVVVVKPLAEFIKGELEAAGREILHWGQTKGHAVFHFRGGKTAVNADPMAPFQRGRQRFKLPQTHYALDTVYGVPEFDSLGYWTTTAFDALKREQLAGRGLIWNPGQGHLPVILQKRFGKLISQMTLASRDLLSLHNSRHNLLAQGMAKTAVTVAHLPDITAVSGIYDFVVIFPDADAGVPWPERVPTHLSGVLAGNGRALISAKTGVMTRMLPHRGRLAVRADKKRHGYRAVLLQKKGETD